MAIQPSSESVGTKSTWPDLLNKSIDVMWMRRNEVEGNVLGQFFEVIPVEGGLTHVITSVSSVLPLPIENEDTEALPYHLPSPGDKKTFTAVNYRSGIRVTDTMIKVDRFAKIQGMCQGLLNSAMQKDEYMRAAILNNAFTGDNGSDSKDLCDDDHPHERKDNTAVTTWDNKSTGAMTGNNLHALRLLSRKMTNEAGDPMPITCKMLVIPEDLEQTAHELIDSNLKPEGALNTTNWGLNFGVTVSPYLSSATQYYLFGSLTGEAKGLVEIEVDPWDIGDNAPANRHIVIDKSIKSIRTVGFTKSKNIFGSTGA